MSLIIEILIGLHLLLSLQGHSGSQDVQFQTDTDTFHFSMHGHQFSGVY